MRPQKNKRFAAAALVLVMTALFGIAGYIFHYLETNLKPALLNLAEARVTAIAVQAINNVVNDKIITDVDSRSLILVKQDQQGRVVLIQPDTAEVNKLSARTALEVQAALRNLSQERIEIPLAQAFGSHFFAGLGPTVNVNIIPAGTVKVNIVDKFDQAGINQTRHGVHLNVTASMRIVVPFVSREIAVSSTVLIAEYVLVGDVPNTYVKIPGVWEYQKEK